MPSFPRQKAPKGHRQPSLCLLRKTRSAIRSTRHRPKIPPPLKETHTRQARQAIRPTPHDAEFGGSGGKAASVDRYGRKVKSDAKSGALRRFYEFEEGEDDEDDETVKRELERVEKKYDPARDGGFSSSESDSDSDGSDSDASIHLGEEDSEAKSGDVEAALAPGGAAVPTGEVTSRLAVVNLDWDNVRAQDIFAVASSFLPAQGGSVVSVTVYPSEFGRQRMEREELEGPPKEIFQSGKRRVIKRQEAVLDESASEEDSEAEEERIKKDLIKEDDDVDFDSNALRKYQLERLRYFYAVITCSSKNVSKALYDAMDGQEYLSSANFFDMRFVPDDVDFDDDNPGTCAIRF